MTIFPRCWITFYCWWFLPEDLRFHLNFLMWRSWQCGLGIQIYIGFKINVFLSFTWSEGTPAEILHTPQTIYLWGIFAIRTYPRGTIKQLCWWWAALKIDLDRENLIFIERNQWTHFYSHWNWLLKIISRKSFLVRFLRQSCSLIRNWVHDCKFSSVIARKSSVCRFSCQRRSFRWWNCHNILQYAMTPY